MGNVLGTIVNRPENWLHKNVPVFVVKADAETGIIEAIVSVMGIIDLGGDVIWNGAYTKTISERFNQIHPMDNHNYESVMSAFGKFMDMHEISRDELPQQIKAKFPSATGGLWVQIQAMMDDPVGVGIFRRVKAGVINEWSIGYDIVKDYMGKMDDPLTGKPVVVRNITEIKLYEISAVLWGMNQATMVTGVKNNVGKPVPTRKAESDAPNYRLAPENAHNECSSCIFYQAIDDQTGVCVKYGFDAKENYVCDGYAPGNEASAKSRKEFAQGANMRMGDYLSSNVFDKYMALCNSMYSEGYVDGAEHRQMCDVGMKLLDVMDGLPEEVRLRPYDKWGGGSYMMWGADPGESVKRIVAESAKKGRMISQANADKLQSAIETISSILQDAGWLENDNSEGSDANSEPGKAEPPAQALTLQDEIQAKRAELQTVLQGSQGK